jgi:structural maintenance of chromosomes protein 6
MAGKRRAVADSDDEAQSQQTTPPSKRARAANSDSEPEVIPVTTPDRKRTRGAKGKGKGRQVNGDESEDEEDVDDEANVTVEKPEDDDEEEEQKFEDEHGDAIRAAIEAKRKIHGVCKSLTSIWVLSSRSIVKGIAEYGIIESITMVQFMCHRYLSFQFGPQINFIIGKSFQQLFSIPADARNSGHNGSEFSVVLSLTHHFIHEQCLRWQKCCIISNYRRAWWQNYVHRSRFWY